MIIVLDTNIFREDFLMNSFKFKILFDFLKKTESKIVVPQIIYQEIDALYRREIEEKISRIEKSRDFLKKILVGGLKQDIELNINGEVKKYFTYFKERLKIGEKNIIPYQDNYLDETVKRALFRIKPCSEKGEEFRDTLLWLTLLDIASSTDDKRVIFISKNVREFASKDGKLDTYLFEDAKKRGVTIKYYKSLDDFIKDKAKQIDFITKEWLLSLITIGTINKKVVEASEQSYYREGLLRCAEDKTKNRLTGYVNLYTANLDIREFYVYEAVDSETYYIQIIYDGEGEAEIEFNEEIKDAQWESWGIARYKPRVKSFIVSLEAVVGIDIEKRNMIEWEVETIGFS